MNLENQESTGSRSPNDLRPEKNVSFHQMAQPMNSDTEEATYMNKKKDWIYWSAELDTPLVNKATTLRSDEAIIDLVQDLTNELLHGGFTYLVRKFLIDSFEVWISFLVAITSACIVMDTWGTILKCSLFLATPFSRFVYISSNPTSLLTS